MKSLYLECNSGISGDMFVAAMLDLGADAARLKTVLDTMPVKGFDVKISRVIKMGLDVADFDVVLDAEYDNQDADMEYLFGHEHDHGHDHHHEHHHDHAHHHEHHYDHEHHHDHAHHHEHRGYNEVCEIIDHTEMTDNAKLIAKKVFAILGEAEAKAHGATLETVHFHEVGALDSIVDIISAAVCFDELGIENVIVPFLTEGQGSVRCAHGILPIPVPAVTNIVSSLGINLKVSNIHAELVTPTGAAIVGAICTDKKLPEVYAIKKCGMGAGKREYERPSILRAMIIESEECKSDRGCHAEDAIYKLEANIDDITGENLGYAMELLFDAGARDVYYTPVYMKKNRPAYMLSVICTEETAMTMEDIIFRETTTIGLRKLKVERSILERKIKTVETSFGSIAVKVCRIDGMERFYPEYEEIKKVCKKTGLSYSQVYGKIVAELN